MSETPPSEPLTVPPTPICLVLGPWVRSVDGVWTRRLIQRVAIPALISKKPKNEINQCTQPRPCPPRRPHGV